MPTKTKTIPPKAPPKAKPNAPAAKTPARVTQVAVGPALIPETHRLGDMPVNPALDDLLLKDSGAGQESMGREDFAIPRISILQALSPAVNKHDPAYVDGAEPGDIYDSVSNKLYSGSEGIEVVMVAYRRCYPEFWPRDSKAGKGFVADHGTDAKILAACQKNDKGAYMTAKGTEIVPTGEYFAYVLGEDGQKDQVLIGMSKSQLNSAKRLNVMIAQYRAPHPTQPGATFNPAMFYRTYKLTTTPVSNDKGNWFVWAAAPGMPLLDMPNGREMYLEARDFRGSVEKGEVKTQSHADVQQHGDSGSSSSAPGESDDAPM